MVSQPFPRVQQCLDPKTSKHPVSQQQQVRRGKRPDGVRGWRSGWTGWLQTVETATVTQMAAGDNQSRISAVFIDSLAALLGTQ